tara:strand:+ start:518 stop:889 length:372 start_codon:yes stop_codon:yes gene_type:complete
MQKLIEFTLIVIIALTAAVGSQTYGNSEVIDFGNGCKMIKSSTDFQNRVYKYVYTIDYPVRDNIGVENFKHVLKNVIISTLGEVPEAEEQMSNGWKYKYTYQSSEASSDKPWTVMFTISEEDL